MATLHSVLGNLSAAEKSVRGVLDAVASLEAGLRGEGAPCGATTSMEVVPSDVVACLDEQAMMVVALAQEAAARVRGVHEALLGPRPDVDEAARSLAHSGVANMAHPYNRFPSR